MTLLRYIIALILLPSLALGAPDRCAATRIFDANLKQLGQAAAAKYVKYCEDSLKALAATNAKIATANPNARQVNVDSTTQAGLAFGAADFSAAGSEVQKQKLAKAQTASFELNEIAKKLTSVVETLDRDTQQIIPRLAEPNRNNFISSAVSAKNDFAKVRDEALATKGITDNFSRQFAASATQLDAAYVRNRQVATQLSGGEQTYTPPPGGAPAPPPPRQGVSANTWAILGGTALIAGGVVGGVAYFGSKAIDKTDNMMEARIKQAEKSGKNLIDDAEKRLKRIIEFSTNKMTKVVKDAEGTAKRIMERAKENIEDLIDKMKTEMRDEFENLTDTGLAKLKKEMNDIFDDLLGKARLDNDSELVSRLLRARAASSGEIESEISRRRIASGGTVNTNTDSTTSPGTDSAVASATATATASESQTETQTQTETDTPTDVTITSSSRAPGKLKR